MQVWKHGRIERDGCQKGENSIALEHGRRNSIGPILHLSIEHVKPSQNHLYSQPCSSRCVVCSQQRNFEYVCCLFCSHGWYIVINEACPLDLATDDLLEADVSKEEMLATLAGVKLKEAVGSGSLLGELFRSSACTILLFAHVHVLPSCFSYAKDLIDKSQH